MSLVYLDWAATAEPDSVIAAAVQEIALSVFANPSSKHAAGRRASDLLETARKRCADALGVPPGTVIFTSGGTESNNMIVFSLLNRQTGGRVLVSHIEHPSCAEPVSMLAHFGWTVDTVGADSAGRVTPDAVEALLSPETCMVCIMAVDNETGAIQPVADIVKRIRSFERRWKRHIHIHCDAVQAFGKIPFDPTALGIDSASISAHKFSGPRGVGLLYCSKETEFLFRGGGQEGRRRHGTENLPAIYGMSLAMEKACVQLNARAKKAAELKSYMVQRLSAAEHIFILPGETERSPDFYSPFILLLSRPPLPGEVLVRMSSDGGFAVSTGSACSANVKKRPGIMKIPGVDEKTAISTIRVSTGYTTTLGDIAAFCSFLEQIRM